VTYRVFLSLFALLFGLLSAAPGQAQLAEPGASAWVEKSHSRMRLVSAVAGMGDAAVVTLGLEVDLADHWKIYWRSPGDAGYPPEMDWTGSVNLAEAPFEWPVPTRFSVLGIETTGYQGKVILPIAARPEQPGNPLIVNATVDYLICSEICVPDQGTFALMIPPGPANPSAFSQDIARARAQVPGMGTSHGITVDEAVLEPGGMVRVAVTADPPLAAPDLFMESEEGDAFSAPEVRLSEGGRKAVLRAHLEGDRDLMNAGLAALVADGVRGVETPIDTTRLAEAAPPSAAAGAGLLAMLGLALVGGLILNLMPCVLPVLSLKVLGLVGHGGGAPARARLSFLATSGGIVASFLVLAGAAIVLKSAGAAVGWGIQFQQPLFLLGMVALLTLFAANLWGLFEIPLPGALSNLGGRGAGGSLAGSFLTGAFATLLATPCSAPFLGTAVGFALAGRATDTLAIFLSLGLGMALPYLAVAAWPRVATRLPRPGAWMVVLRRVMGLALAGTALWLLTVLAAQRGLETAALVGGAMVLVVGLLAVARVIAGTGKAVAGIVALMVIGSGVLVAQPDAAISGKATTEAHWRPWSTEETAKLVAEGKTVLVDVTADWCVTCLVNKAAVLDRGAVAELLGGGDVVALRADWTRPDPAIAAYLASFGRYGIPFNAVYGPKAPQGIALPELLTEGAVLDAVAAAGDTALAEK
jgi:suppressor for copper-sensitivity B